MKNIKPRRPIWPYLGILICLVAIILTIPRSWQRDVDNWDPLPPPTVDLGELVSGDPAVEQERDSQELQIQDKSTMEAPPPLVEPEAAPASEVFGAFTDTSEEDAGLSPEDRYGLISESAADPSIVSDPVPPVPQVVVSDSSDRVAMVPAQRSPLEEIHPDRVPVFEPEPETAQFTLVDTTPTALIHQLERLQTRSETEPWASEVLSLLEQLGPPSEMGEQVSSGLLANLRKMVKSAESLADGIYDEVWKMELNRTLYALTRRLDLREPIYGASFEEEPSTASTPESADDLAQHVSTLVALIDETPHGQSWREYFMLDALESMVVRGGKATEAEKRELARDVMARIKATRNAQSRNRFTHEKPLKSLDLALRRWSEDPVDMDRFLSNLEAYEESGFASDARRVAEDYQALLYAPDEMRRGLAKRADWHYRNANLRIAVTEELLNRWMPAQRPTHSRINDFIAGADVEGYSRTITRLSVKLFPDRHRLKLALEAFGIVDSDTASNSGPATLYSEGRTLYAAQKMVVVDGQRGLLVAPTRAEARSDNDLVDMATDFDGVPLIGPVVQNIVRKKHDERHPQALSEIEQRVIAKARRQMDHHADQRIARAEQAIRRELLAPLRRLSLGPTPIDLHTTDKRLIMRLRLASDEQLGAHTPRPQAPSNSLASLQVHESALNNSIEQMQLDGQSFTLPELYRFVSERIGKPIDLPEDLPEAARITFVERDAVRAHLRDGRLEVTLAVAELEQGRNRFEDFIVRAYYVPHSNGLQTELARDGSIELSGKRLNFKAQIALRGVFSKFFSKHRRPQLISEKRASNPRLAGLVVNQLVIDDGWLGLAIAPDRKTAARKAVRR